MVSAFLTSLDVKGSTSRKTKTVMQSILAYGIGQGYIKSNPCVAAIWKSGEEEGNPNYLNKEQAKQLLKLVDNCSTFNTFIKVLLFTGMRSGECLGLRHTNASLLTFAGEDISAISKYLGHSTVDITSRVYAHMFSEVNVRVPRTISSALL